jgi:chloramphenicol 3-O phosphotransferase
LKALVRLATALYTGVPGLGRAEADGDVFALWRLTGLPALFVGVRCPIDVLLERRRATWGVGRGEDGSIPEPVSLWQDTVHTPGIYDMEVDTSMLSAEACAAQIRQRLEQGPPAAAFERLAESRPVTLNS